MKKHLPSSDNFKPQLSYLRNVITDPILTERDNRLFWLFDAKIKPSSLLRRVPKLICPSILTKKLYPVDEPL